MYAANAKGVPLLCSLISCILSRDRAPSTHWLGQLSAIRSLLPTHRGSLQVDHRKHGIAVGSLGDAGNQVPEHSGQILRGPCTQGKAGYISDAATPAQSGSVAPVLQQLQRPFGMVAS